MILNATETQKLADIASKHSTNIQAAIMAAYEEGLLEGALRIAKMVANNAAAPTAPANSGNGDDNTPDAAMTAHDKHALMNLGIDPGKKFRLRNTEYTITAYKPSRWKFPVSAVTQNGTRYKFSIATVKTLQAAK